MRDYAESTQQYIDEEISRLIAGRYEMVKSRLSSKKLLLDYVAARLLDKEIIEAKEFAEIIAAEANLTPTENN